MPPDPPIECTVCKMPLVEGCRNAPGVLGGGIIHKIRNDDLVAVPCPNMAVIRLRQRLANVHSQLPSAKHDPTTPLYQRGRVDRTRDNILFTSTLWKTFLGHLKWVVASKDVFVRVATDMTLMNVYVGNTSVKSRLKEQLQNADEPLLISNSLEDFLSGPDLVVVPLGHIIHPNKAAANILHESLSLRMSLGKPTWLLERPGMPFVPYTRSDHGIPSGMPSCNDDVLALVNSRFERIHLPSTEPEVELETYAADEGLESEIDEPGTDESEIDDILGRRDGEGPSELGEMTPEDPPPVRSRAAARAEEELIESLQGPTKKRKSFGSSGPRKGGYR